MTCKKLLIILFLLLPPFSVLVYGGVGHDQGLKKVPLPGFAGKAGGDDSLHLVKMLQGGAEPLEYAFPAGDLNGEGYGDFVVKYTHYAEIYLGNRSFTILPAFGIRCDICYSAGNVNGDGYDDLVIMRIDTPFTGYYRAKAFMVYGKAAPDSSANYFFLVPYKAYSRYSSLIEKLGDINGDGYDDFAVASYTNFWTDGMGWVYIFYGGRALADTPAVTLNSGRLWAKDYFGYVITGIGDLNKDGQADFIISAPSIPEPQDSSKLRIYLGGKEIDTVPYRVIKSSSSNSRYYWEQVKNAGDLNSDGINEFFAAMGDTVRNTYLFFKPDSIMRIKPFTVYNGLYIGTGGDINNDGFDDFFLADLSFINGNGIVSGMIKGYWGGGSIDTTADFMMFGNTDNAQYGKYSAITKDFNGDGYDDVIVGEPRYPSGRLYILSYPLINRIEDTHKEGLAFSLNNYPNPFNPVTIIKFDLPKASEVNLTIYDLMGSEVTRIAEGYQEAGRYQVEWNAANYASGVYFCVLKAGSYNSIKKMMLVK